MQPQLGSSQVGENNAQLENLGVPLGGFLGFSLGPHGALLETLGPLCWLSWSRFGAVMAIIDLENGT
eukprot:8227392-Pyramimonas_sp.AAC.1